MYIRYVTHVCVYIYFKSQVYFYLYIFDQNTLKFSPSTILVLEINHFWSLTNLILIQRLLIIPSYSMSLFKLPKSICDNINFLLARYWWGQNHEERKIRSIN